MLRLDRNAEAAEGTAAPPAPTAAYGEFLLVESEEGIDYTPPHEGARLVAWFRPPEADRTYNVDFSIVASPGSYSLETSDGTETTEVPGPLLDWDKHLSTTFHAHSHDWFSFTLSGTMFWQLNHCEINVLP